VLTLVFHRPAAASCFAGLLACAGASAQEAFRFPASGTSFASGAKAEASWNAPCDRAAADEAELVLSLDDGITFPIRLTEEMPPCASTHRWRVPNVESSHARLGVRRGREGRGGEERIVLVSARFTIVSGVRSSGAGLTRGAAEWWTDQALFAFAAEDFLDETLGRVPRYAAGRVSAEEADDPSPESHSWRAETRQHFERASSVADPLPAREPAPPVCALVPLRL
jgi:hypothetical protein